MLKDDVVLGLIHTVIGFHSQLFCADTAIGITADSQQNQHRAGGNEQHVAFAQGIEGTVVQNHAGHNVHNAGLFLTFFDVPLTDLVVNRVVSIAEGGQMGGRGKKQRNDGNADNHRKQTVQHTGGLLTVGGSPLMSLGIHGLLFRQLTAHSFFPCVLSGLGFFNGAHQVTFTAFVVFLGHGFIQLGGTALQPTFQARPPAVFIIISDVCHRRFPPLG